MNCPSCGASLASDTVACGCCGSRIPLQPSIEPTLAVESDQETVLYRVGPFGISIRFGKPGLFAASMRNAVEVVLTDRRLCGVWKPPLLLKLISRHRDPLYFNVPLAAVTAVEPVRFAAVHALWLHWAEGGAGGAEREVAIEGALLHHGDIQRIYELLWARIAEAARNHSAARMSSATHS